MAAGTESVPQSVLHFAVDKISGDLTEAHRKSLFKLLICLRNDSPRAHRLAKMYDQGQIDGDTLLKMMG